MNDSILFFDIETEMNPEALEFIQEPKAPSNYKDPDKIKAFIEEKRAEIITKAALDEDYGRIIAIAYSLGDNPIEVITGSESDILKKFWNLYKSANGISCGYNIIGFDLPYLMRRSFYFGIKIPIIPSLAKYRSHPTIDLMGILYNWGQDKGLKWVCKRYGIDNPLPDLDGSKVAEMDIDTLKEYAANDVRMTVELYNKMQGIYF